MSRFARASVGVILGMAVATAACGGGGTKRTGIPPPTTAGSTAAAAPGRAPANLDPCSLVTAEDVRAATGVTTTGEKSGTTTCRYQLGAQGVDRILVEVTSPFGAQAFRRVDTSQEQPVPGLGEKAAWTLTDPASQDLRVLKGDTLVSIDFEGPMAALGGRNDVPRHLEAAKALARVALARVP